jgi:hypothetical protein
MELWLLDNHHETVAGSDSKLAEPHEKNERLKRNQSAAMTARRKGHLQASRPPDTALACLMDKYHRRPKVWQSRQLEEATSWVKIGTPLADSRHSGRCRFEDSVSLKDLLLSPIQQGFEPGASLVSN